MKNSELSAFIDDMVPSKRNRELLKERLIDGIKVKDLALAYDLSERQVKNIIKKFRQLL
jgi:Mor family transcriptional regulator